MKAFTNVKPKKKAEKETTKQKVLKTFEKAEDKAEKNLSADMKKAHEYQEGMKKKANEHVVNTGRTDTRKLQASGAYAGVAANSSHNELSRVRGLQQTGAYDAKPAVVGGTKKMLVRSKKNVNKSMASPQAKKSARKLY